MYATYTEANEHILRSKQSNRLAFIYKVRCYVLRRIENLCGGDGGCGDIVVQMVDGKWQPPPPSSCMHQQHQQQQQQQHHDHRHQSVAVGGCDCDFVCVYEVGEYYYGGVGND